MQNNNLTDVIHRMLSTETRAVLSMIAGAAADKGYGLYLVGGVVRDMLLGRENFDLDLVVEGDAITLARYFAELVHGKVITHSRFKTAKVTWDGQGIDLVTARSETYRKPGALPNVQPGILDDDLARRDFTINSMAVNLLADGFGELIDPWNGQGDLKKKLIRILHDNSFIDDATRIWRAIRYEQRLDFTIEENTLDLLSADPGILNTVSSNRIRHELELMLKEKQPEKALKRAKELGVLDSFYPGIETDEILINSYKKAREFYLQSKPPVEVYLALLLYPQPKETKEEIASCFNLTKKQTVLLNDTEKLKNRLDELAQPGIRQSAVYNLLADCSLPAINTVLIAEDSRDLHKIVSLYLNKLRYVIPALSGADLQELGVSSGPEIKKILDRLLTARLDGEVTDREGEIELVKKLMGK